MIEKITVKNFLSFKEEIDFDFSASMEKPKKGFEYINWYEQINKKKILKALFLFGNNGTGKSNFLKAIATLRTLVCKNSKSKSEENDKIPDCYFKLSENSRNVPSVIKIIFNTEGLRYLYEIAWHDNVIVKEQLEKKEGTRRTTCIFSRSFDYEKDLTEILYPSKILNTDTQRVINNNTIKNSSVISIYDGMNIESPDLKNVYTYFLSIRIIPSLDDLDLLSMIESRKDQNMLKSILLTLLKDLGSNIIDYQIDNFEVKIDENESRFLRNYIGEERFNKEFPNGSRKVKSIRFGHPTDIKDKIGWLRENEESLGTLNMIKLIIAFYDGCIYNAPIIIDECSYGIHQLTFGRIIQFFLAFSESSQAIMASQNLSIMDMEGFRRDTIKFFDKNRLTGETSCQKVNLRKYHKNQSITNAYLDNSFGSLPEFPNFEIWKEHLLNYKNIINTNKEETNEIS